MDKGQFRFHPFDPDSGLIPEIAEFGPLAERSGGCGIILIAVPDVETPSWCAQAAAALVTTWSTHGARILLADVSLAQPILHEVVGLPNSEGVVDVMMNGAQLRNVSRLVGSPDFLFISAGTPTGDIANVMRSGRWDIVLEALGEAEFHLVMYAPADLPGLDALLERGPAVLLLGRNTEVAEEAIRDLGLSATDGLGPPVDEGIPGGVGTPSKPPGVVEPVVSSFGVLEPVVGAFEVLADGADSRETVPKLAYLRRVPLWMVGTTLGLLVLAVWAGSRVLGGEATLTLEVLEERAQPPTPIVAPPLRNASSLFAFLGGVRGPGGSGAPGRESARAARRSSLHHRSRSSVGQGLSSHSCRTGAGFGGRRRASNVAG